MTGPEDFGAATLRFGVPIEFRSFEDAREWAGERVRGWPAWRAVPAPIPWLGWAVILSTVPESQGGTFACHERPSYALWNSSMRADFCNGIEEASIRLARLIEDDVSLDKGNPKP